MLIVESNRGKGRMRELDRTDGARCVLSLGTKKKKDEQWLPISDCRGKTADDKRSEDLKPLLRNAGCEARVTVEGEAEICLEPQAAPGEGGRSGKKVERIGLDRLEGCEEGRERCRRSRGRGQTAARSMQKNAVGRRR